jgi:hypothetical protein
MFYDIATEAIFKTNYFFSVHKLMSTVQMTTKYNQVFVIKEEGNRKRTLSEKAYLDSFYSSSTTVL